MSELERLIQEYCPNGVLFKTIDELCDVFTGGEAPADCIKGKPADDVCKYPVYSNGINENAIYGYSASYVIDKTGVTFSSIGTIGHPEIREAKFTPIIRLKVIIPKNDNVLSVGFLKYALEVVDFTQNKSSVPNVNAKMIKAIKVPVPPIDIQNKIVRILDNFKKRTTELTTDLASELTARKKQYYHYRRTLIENAPDLQPFSLGDLATIKTGNKPEMILETQTDYEYINAGTSNSGYAESSNCSGDTVTTPSRGQGGIGFVGYQKNPFWLGPLCYRIQSKDTNIVLNRYLYYYLTCFNEKILAFKKEGGTPAVNASDLLGIDIVVPPLAEQQRIVDILDRFDALYNDISAGIPAEIEARQKQYEYYRDKLLTFKEASE